MSIRTLETIWGEILTTTFLKLFFTKQVPNHNQMNNRNTINTINKHYKIFSTYYMFNIDNYISTQLDQTVFTACLTIFASSFCCMQHSMSPLSFQLVSPNPPRSPSSPVQYVPPSSEPAMAPSHSPIRLAPSPRSWREYTFSVLQIQTDIKVWCFFLCATKVFWSPRLTMFPPPGQH